MSARQIIFTYAWDMCRYAHADYKMSRPSSKLQKTFMRGQNMCVSQADEHRVRYGSYNKLECGIENRTQNKMYTK